MGKMSPRAQIRNECKRAISNIEWALKHLMKCSWWCEKGGHPEIARYVEELGKAGLMYQDAIRKFLKEL